MKQTHAVTGVIKVRHEGGSIVLAVGKLLPPDWHFVRVGRSKTDRAGNIVLLVKKIA